MCIIKTTIPMWHWQWQTIRHNQFLCYIFLEELRIHSVTENIKNNFIFPMFRVGVEILNIRITPLFSGGTHCFPNKPLQGTRMFPRPLYHRQFAARVEWLCSFLHKDSQINAINIMSCWVVCDSQQDIILLPRVQDALHFLASFIIGSDFTSYCDEQRSF